jgi:hypothetical protein
MNRFIAGTSLNGLVESLPRMFSNNYIPIIDYAKEGAKRLDDVVRYKNIMRDLITMINKKFPDVEMAYAVKLSSYMQSQVPHTHIMKVLEYINKTNHPKMSVFFDAEHSNNLEDENKVFNRILDKNQCNMSPNYMLYKTYQMYRKDAMEQLVLDLNRFDKLGVKIVRGAYHVKSNPIMYKNKAECDANYNGAVEYLLDRAMKNPNIHVCFATHNKTSVNLALDVLEKTKMDKPIPNVSFAQLLGMGDELGHHIKSKSYPVFKYTPYGSFLETYPYLVRRLIENNYMIRYILFSG